MARVIYLFVSMMISLGWTAFWLRNQPKTAQTEKTWQTVYLHQAVRFRETAEDLGGMLIKVGQFLSSRVDLLPQPFIDELQTLQDQVSAVPWDKIEPILLKDLGPISATFKDFDTTPLAAASLGQVYQAHLWNGRKVAVKVQRPQIRCIVSSDLKALGIVVQITTRFTNFGRSFDLFTVLREFHRTVFDEINYGKELENTETVRQTLKDIPWVHIPHVFPEYSTGRILTMEFYTGIKINQVAELKAHHIDPGHVAEEAINLYLHMVFDIGIFHADPHPGNILVNDQGDLILLDYGMIGRIDWADKQNLRKLFVAISERNPQAIIDSMAALGMVPPQAQTPRLKRHIRYLLDRYYAETLDQLNRLDLPALFKEFEDLLRSESIQMPGHYAFLGRAIAILVGIATTLDPHINLVQLFKPYVTRFITEEQGGKFAYARQKAKEWGQSLTEWPLISSRVLHKIDQGDLQTQLSWEAGTDEIRRLGRQMLHLTQSVYIIGIALIAALLWIHHSHIFAEIVWGIDAVLFIFWRRPWRE
ncbi:MAG: AarF/UbiB family protein [Firmicutes bacterium]|nr:AarF/UbiB family protein [Bacillota bacterium]